MRTGSIAWAQARGDAEDVVERLFRAYFLEGRFIGERAVLAAIAGEAGFAVDEARAYLESDAGADAIEAMDRRVRELGVTGVPFFIFDGKVGVSGAQEAAGARRGDDRGGRGRDLRAQGFKQRVSHRTERRIAELISPTML